MDEHENLLEGGADPTLGGRPSPGASAGGVGPASSGIRKVARLAGLGARRVPGPTTAGPRPRSESSGLGRQAGGRPSSPGASPGAWRGCPQGRPQARLTQGATPQGINQDDLQEVPTAAYAPSPHPGAPHPSARLQVYRPEVRPRLPKSFPSCILDSCFWHVFLPPGFRVRREKPSLGSHLVKSGLNLCRIQGPQIGVPTMHPALS